MRYSREISGWKGENAWERVKDNIRKIAGGWIAWCLISHCKGLAFAYTVGRDGKLLKT